MLAKMATLYSLKVTRVEDKKGLSVYVPDWVVGV